MFASLLRTCKIKWRSTNYAEEAYCGNKLMQYLLLEIYNLISWKRKYVTIAVIIVINTAYIFNLFENTKFSVVCLKLGIFLLCIEGLEAWLKYKHRESFLNQLAKYNNEQEMFIIIKHLKHRINKQWCEFKYTREVNHTKAFIIANIFFGALYIIGNYISGVSFVYIGFMITFTCHFALPVINKLIKKVQNYSDSDEELESLIPKVSDADMLDLAIEPEKAEVLKTIDYWKPEPNTIDDVESSSDESSSAGTNLSLDKISNIDNNTDTTDSSENEYIPLVEKENPVQSTLEVVEPETWGSSAMNMLRNLTSYSSTNVPMKKEAKSNVKYEPFEVINKSDL